MTIRSRALLPLLFLIAASLQASARLFPVSHDLTLASGLSVTIDSAAAGTVPVFNATGTVTLGGTLTVTATGAPFTTGKTYLLIANDGTDAVIGTFAGRPEGSIITSGGQSFRITYIGGTGNDVVLTAVDATAIPTLDPAALMLLAAGIATIALFALRS